MSGVYLNRVDALHVVRQHYLYANWSICRFASHLHGDYAADLIFEVDAHVKGFPGWQLDHEFYRPIVEAAVAVGSRLLAYLIGELGVDARYITTCVTRMGCRVTVDWRAFGPRRLWTLLAVVRWIENQVFEPDELANMGIELRKQMLAEGERLGRLLAEDFGPLDSMNVTASVKVDGAIYGRSDLPRIDREHGGNTFKGPFVRPVGSLHSGSSTLNMFCRTTPVPHDQFATERAEWLTRVSRAETYNPTYGPSVHDHLDPKLFHDLWRWPEARDPRGDHVIETDPTPCSRLMELFERADDLQDGLSADALDEIKTVRRKAMGSGIRAAGETHAEIERADAAKIMSGLREAKYQRGGRVRAICPFCDKLPVSLTIYTTEGHGHCFRCVRTFSLVDIAIKLGLEKVVRWRRHSSSPIQRVPVESLPPAADVTTWGKDAVVIAPEFETLAEARADQLRVLDTYLSNRDDWDLLVLRGPTGIGKTYGAIERIGRHGFISRGLFARSEARAPFLLGLSPSRAIDGRRPDNCANYPRIADARDRLIPEWTVCKACARRPGCPYLAQFHDIEGVHLALLHAHAQHLHRPLFDNGAEITVIDENAWDRCIELVDIDARELELFKCEMYVEVDEDGTVGLDDPIEWRAPTEAVGRLVDALAALLRSDAVLVAQGMSSGSSDAAKHGEWTKHGSVADRDLARLLFGPSSALTQALLDLGEADYEAVEARSSWLAGLDEGQDRPRLRRPPKRILRELCQALQAAWCSHVTDRARTLPIAVHRQDTSTEWTLRLTRRHLIESGQTILASSTVRPEQVRLAFGPDRRVVVYAPTVKQRERRIVVPDRSYSLSQLAGKRGQPSRDRLFETIKKLVESEYARTGLPVAVIGRSELMNLWSKFMLGDAAKPLRMPWGAATREEHAQALRALTIPLGYISGYAGGVAGSNRFSVDVEPDAGVPPQVQGESRVRFVRSLIILGNLIPPLGQQAAALRGVYSGEQDLEPFEYPGIGTMFMDREVVLDWTPTFRTVPIQAPEVGSILVTRNMIGFVDPRANELLHASYEAEFIQIAGRMRGSIPDPVDPTIEPKLWVFAGVALGAEFPFDEVLGLEEVRERLGLEVLKQDSSDANPRHRPIGSSKNSIEDQVFRRWKKEGPARTIWWLAAVLRGRGTPWAATGSMLAREVRDVVSRAGFAWRDCYDASCTEAIIAANSQSGQSVPR